MIDVLHDIDTDFVHKMAAKTSTLLRNTVNKCMYLLQNGRHRFLAHRATEPSLSNTQPDATLSHQVLSQRHHESGRWVSSNKVEVNGAQINYDIAGTGKKVVLLCPGALGSSRTDFSKQLDNMNKDMFTVIAWDPRGYGGSTTPKRDWPLHFLERDALDGARLMENIGSSMYSLLGWSDGGITAMLMAARYPERVRRLVVWGANAFVTQQEVDFYESIRDISKWSAAMRDPFINLYGEEYFQEQWGSWIDAITRYLHERNGDICEEELSKISCPTLIIHGEQDPVVPQFHPEHLKKHIRNSRLINLPEGKHNLHMRHHHKFNSIVESFLIE